MQSLFGSSSNPDRQRQYSSISGMTEGADVSGIPMTRMGNMGNMSGYLANMRAHPSLDLARRQAERATPGTQASLGDQLSMFMKEKVDISSLQEAGFGAAGHHLDRAKKQAYDAMFLMSAPVRSKLLLAIREMVKEQAVADPDMCYYARSRIESIIDLLWHDLLIYQEKMVEDARLAAVGLAASDHDGLAALGHNPVFFTPFWWRAKLLYHYVPFDKSIFGQAKDPIFWIFLVISLTPFYGIRVIFFLLVFLAIMRGCPADEYQLVNFILAFKGTQVISSGFLMSLLANVKFYLCMHPHRFHQCDIEGPGATMDLISSSIDFIGSILLVWTAFLFLPCSTHSAGLRKIEDDDGDDIEDLNRAAAQSDSDAEDYVRRNRCCGRCCRGGIWCCCCRWNPSRGGRLAGLLIWDLFSFCVSCAFLFSLAYLEVTHSRPGGEPKQPIEVNDVEDVQTVMSSEASTWHFRTAFFLTRVLYSTMAMPFLFFQIPLLSSILTHTSPTGYNRQGLCVPYMLPPVNRGN